MYKEKLRLRSYGTPSPGDTVFVELKKKFQGVVYTRRVAMTLEQTIYFKPSDSAGHLQSVIMLVNGNIGTALLLVVCIGAVLLLLETLHFGEPKQSVKILKITIPENLDYEGLFDDLLQEFTRRYHLIKVKTVSMGSLYELQYRIELNWDKSQKEFLDAIRCRNGNLTVACGVDATDREEL